MFVLCVYIMWFYFASFLNFRQSNLLLFSSVISDSGYVWRGLCHLIIFNCIFFLFFLTIYELDLTFSFSLHFILVYDARLGSQCFYLFLVNSYLIIPTNSSIWLPILTTAYINPPGIKEIGFQSLRILIDVSFLPRNLWTWFIPVL